MADRRSPLRDRMENQQSRDSIFNHPDIYAEFRVSEHAPKGLLNEFKSQTGVLSELTRREELMKQGAMDPEVITLTALCSRGNALDALGDYAAVPVERHPRKIHTAVPKATGSSHPRTTNPSSTTANPPRTNSGPANFPLSKIIHYSIELTVKNEADLKLIRPLHIMGSRPNVFNEDNKRPRVRLCIREVLKYNQLKKERGEEETTSKFLGDIEWEKKALEWSDRNQKRLKKLAAEAGEEVKGSSDDTDYDNVNYKVLEDREDAYAERSGDAQEYDDAKENEEAVEVEEDFHMELAKD